MFKHNFMHELASILKNNKNTYIMLVDVCNFIQFNEDVGFKSGDVALREAIRRIGNHTSEDMDLMTLAGDEWIIFTHNTDFIETEEIAKKILQYNGTDIVYAGIKKPLYLRIALVKADAVDAQNSVFAARCLGKYMEQLKESAEYLLDLS